MKRTFLIDDSIKFIVSEKKLIQIIDGSALKLRVPAAFCLALLIEKQGELVTHQELYDYGWQRFGMSVSASVLHNTIFYLRQALSNFGGFDTSIIETIPRRGFVLSGKVNIQHKTLHIDEVKSELATDASSEACPLSADRQSHFLYPLPFTFPFSKMDKSGWLIFQTAVLAIALIASLMWIIFNETTSRTLFPYNYDYAGQMGNCRVYHSRMSRQFTDPGIDRSFTQFCNATPYIYITSPMYADRVSIIKCRSKISVLSTDACVSDYYLYTIDMASYE